MIAAALSALLLSATPQLEAAASAGGGYDSNANLGATADAIASGFAALRASGGASLDLAEATTLYGGLRFDDEEYPSYPDLTTRSAGLEASLVQEVGARAAVVLTPWLTQSWSGDPNRDATTLAAQLTLRVKPTRTVALRAFYAHVSRNAFDDVFSSERDRVGASAEWRLFPRTYLSLAGSVERGDEAFYVGTAAPMGGATGRLATGRAGSGGGSGQATYRRAPASTRAIGPALEVGLDRTFYLLGTFEARVVDSEGTSYPTQTLFVGLGARI
jgi:hypothetical protein